MKKILTKEEKSKIIPYIRRVLNGAKTWNTETLHFPVEAGPLIH